MQVQEERSQEEVIRELQSQVENLIAINESLQEQLNRKEQFIAMIAHELRGPLTPIISYAQMIARHVYTPSTPGAEIAAQGESQHGSVVGRRKRENAIPRHTGIIIGQARRLMRLVDDLLDVTRLTSGKFTLLTEQCDIALLVKEAIEQLRPIAPYHTLVCDIPELPVLGNYDAMRLQQAVGNLLDNATKYSDEQTTVTAKVWITPGFAHISIHNQGASISATDVSQLFRPYTRLNTTAIRRGSGLGLYITKSIIDAHGGFLHIEPHTEDETSHEHQGTTFIIDLPLQQQ